MKDNEFEIVNLKGIRINLDNYKYVLIVKTSGMKHPVKFSNDIDELKKALNKVVNQCVFKYEKINDFKWYCEELDISYEIINVDDLYK